MVTAILILLAVLVVLMVVAVCWHMTTSPVWLIYHMVCGTLNGLTTVLGLILEAIWKQNE